MRRFMAVGAVALLALVVAVPFATAGTAAPKAVAGNFIGTYVGEGPANGTLKIAFRFEVRTDASGAVQFGYYQTEPLGSPSQHTIGTVTWAKFYRDASGAKAAMFGGTECNVAEDASTCNHDYVVVVTDAAPDTFCGGVTATPCMFPFSVDDGNIAISLSGQNLQ